MYTFSRIDTALPTLGAVVHDGPADLFAGAAIERFRPGRGIFWEEDASEDMYQILEGVVRLYRMLSDGRRVMVGFLFPGDLLGVSWQQERSFTAEAVSGVRLQRVPRSAFFDSIARTAGTGHTRRGHSRDEMCAAQDQMTMLLRRSADERVAAFLTFVADRNGTAIVKGAEVHLAMPRIDIADYLGLSMETVSRSISKLRDRGIIRLNGPSRLLIEKPRMLLQLAEGDANVLEYVMSASMLPGQCAA